MSAPGPTAAGTAVAASSKPPREEDPRNPVARLARFFDDGTTELLTPWGDEGMVAARGRVDGTEVVAFAADPTIQGGAMGEAGCKVILTAYDAAMEAKSPIVGLWHSGGARLAEGVVSLHAVGEVFAAMTRASGVIPQISLVLGAAAGGAAYGPALTDLVVLGPDGRVFVTGPDVVRSVTGEQVDALRLGGPEPHGRRSGVVHVVTTTDEEAFERTRALCALLGDQGELDLAAVTDRDLAATFPSSPKRAYDVHPLVADLLDGEGAGDDLNPMAVTLPPHAVELHPRWAPNIVTVLGRLGGRTVGVVANNPMRLGGCLDSSSAEKAARFVRLCDAMGVPLVVLVDVPGYLPGVGQEWDGVVRRGAKLLHAFAEAVVPRVTLVTRKTYGGAYIAMNSRSLGATKVFAWPEAEMAVMGHVAAVRILHRRKLAELEGEDRARVEQELADEHAKLSGGLARGKEIGVIDDVIEPAATRTRIAAALAEAPQRRGRHGNIPL